ncbi:hypothetical protein SSX86_001322 [Deinandra increscens subsp. villosa]|uniref:DUF4378 domain-containing protein n=1 Tax=Deinandra increscens subsp. villosa TaxID=3103831 RepID=A0AAP0HAP9_9ASTR
MARKSLKCPPTVEPNQTGCVWNFSDMFDHHHHHHHRSHGGSNRKLLSDESHRSKTLPGAEHGMKQVRMLTFDEQIRSINNESKAKTKNANQSNHTREMNTMERSFWKKIKSRCETAHKKKESTKILDTIVILKPSRRVIDRPVDVGCRCSNLHTHHSSTSKQQIVKLKSSKKLKNIRKMKSLSEVEGNGSKTEKLTLVPFSKKQEPEVFVEARRHLAARLRLVAQGAGLVEPLGSSSKRMSRTLERVLLSSPKHESMASFGHEPEGTHGAQSLQKTWTCSSPLNLDSSPLGSQLEFSLDVSSPKADCKLNHDQFRENPSPVSVLDSFFADNICSPTSTIESGKHTYTNPKLLLTFASKSLTFSVYSSPVELQIQPHRLDFEEHSSQTPSPPRKTSLSSPAEDPIFISSYVSDIYQLSHSNWDEFLATDYPLEPSCDENKLFHDYVKEVLVTLHSQVTFISPKIRHFSSETDVVNEVIAHVDWHNGQPAGPRTLDHLMRKDIAKCGKWVDSLSDQDNVVFEVVDETLLELIMEAIEDIYV